MAVGSWTEWSQFVLKELERLDDCYKALECKRSELKKTIEATKQELKDDQTSLKVEQAKINTKLAIIVAVLTTAGNGLLFILIKAIWPIIKQHLFNG